MGFKKIKVEKALYAKAVTYAEAAGYADVDEFVTHMLEKALSGIEDSGDSVEEVVKRLQGLGYLA